MTNGNDSAYPEPFTECDGSTQCTGGLTKREAFAMAAMQAVMTGWCDANAPWKDYLPDMAAARAVQCADALIEALNSQAAGIVEKTDEAK